MSRTSPRCAIAVLASSLILAVTFASSAAAAVRADAGGGSLATEMLDKGDLPASFQPDASLTGPLTGERAQELGVNPGQAGSLDTWVRTWQAPDRFEVVETAADTGTHSRAQEIVAAAVAMLTKQGAIRQPVAGFAVYGGYIQPSRTRYFVLVLPLARGPYAFSLHVVVPAASAAAAGPLMGRLAAAQVRRVPADTPDTAPASDASGVAGTVVGVFIGYLLLVDGVAYLRNPLRRKLWRARSRRVRPEQGGYGSADVSAAAKRTKRTAVARLTVQLAGLGLVAYAADVFQVRYWYAYLVPGLVIVWAGGRFIRPAGADRDKNRAIMAGSHRILVTVMVIVASAMILCGLAAIVSYGLYQTLPQGATLQSFSGQGTITVQSLSTGLAMTGIVLLVVGAVTFRIARRIAAVHARQLMLRDPRPPVLYLRAFGDDRLKLWTATFGRPSLIERFTLRRFDRFEEVLVRHLSRYGPVIAVNRPGTRLAPLGAARETIESADWQSAVANWMAQSALIVFLAPPLRATEGLQWELQTVSEHGYWDKTLVIVPPVRAEHLQRRWQEFRAAYPGLWPFTVAGPVEDPRALLLAFRQGQWMSITADRRTEWSYSAALRGTLRDPRQFVPAPAPGRRPAPRRGPLTLPVAALLVVGAAAVAGAGTWYALRQAPVARLAAGTSSSIPATPGSAPPSPSDTDSSPSAATSPPASPAALVSLAPAAAQYPGAAAIEAVINQYFQAINSRDYAAYVTTQSPGNALTAQQFQSGFESTQDSGAVVTSLTTAPDGRPAADVTFTSKQQPQDGPGGESCTNWQVTLFFDNSGGTYTIGAPPSSYHAAYQACT